VTTLTTPWLIRASRPTAAWVDRKLPKPLQTFVALYGSWIERLRSAPHADHGRSVLRRPIRLLLLDAILLAGVVIGTSIEMEPLTQMLTNSMGFTHTTARILILGAAGVVAVPLVIGLLRMSRVLGLKLATLALPAAPEGKLDIAAAPRRALVVTLQLVIVALIGAPLIAVMQPFLPPFRGTAALFTVLVGLGIAFWRSATNLQGHVRAGAEVIVATLAEQMSKESTPAEDDAADAQKLTQVHAVLPGLGEPVPVRIGASSFAVDKTLAQLNLRGLTGATVLAITRGGDQVLLPVGKEVLHDGDVLALAGTQDAVNAARDLLRLGAEHVAPPQLASTE
jgi:CPA2 family monovalent cation:H+ antiporter-2